MQEYVSYSAHGQQLWFPHMTQQELVTLGIVWEHGDPKIKYATIEVESGQQQHRDQWNSVGTNRRLETIPVSDRALF
jgi:hypothetical protein